MTQAIVFDERPGNRRSTSNPPTFEIGYLCAGIFDSGVVKSSALNLTAPLVATAEGILYRDNIRVTEKGFGIYDVDVTYVQKKDQTGNYRFDYSTTGGTLHLRYSRETVEVYNKSGGTLSKTHFKNAIDPDPKDWNQPRGTEVVVPAMKFNYTFKHPNGSVTEAFAVALARITATVNESVWHNFQPGEVLFLGSEGGDGTDSEAEVKYEFVCQENLQNLVIGGITGIAKDGLDFLWVWWEPDVTSSQPSVKPKAVFVERLYRRINFQAALGF